MRVSVSFIFVLFLLISNYCFSQQIKNFHCDINLSTSIKNISPLEMSAPAVIKIMYNSKTNNLIDYIWNEKSVIKDFELISNNFSSEFIEIGRKGYKKTLSDKDIRNGLYFKLNFKNFKANLKKQFMRPVNYTCL